MSEINKFILEEYNRFIKTDQNGIKYAIKDEIREFKISNIEKEIIKLVFLSNNIDLRDRKITKDDRPSKVSDYEYKSTLGFEELDEPVHAQIEYEGNQKVFENFEKLDDFLINEFIPENVQIKVNKNGNYKGELSKDGVKNRYPSIQWNKIQKLKLSEAENEYVLKKLRDEGIRIGGYAQGIDEDFENYDYVSTFSNKKYPEPLNKFELQRKFIEYKEEKDEKKKAELREELILRNARLVPWIAWNIAKYYNMELQEVEQMGFEGLIYAVEKYDPYYGCVFSTYASECIRGFIFRSISNQLGISYNPNIDNLGLFKRALYIVEKNWGREFDGNEKMLDEIVKLMNEFIDDKHSISYLEKFKNKIRMLYPESIEKIKEKTSLDDENEEDFYSDIESNITYSEKAEDNLIRKNIDDILKTLTEREQKILTMRFGLDGGNPKTLEDVGRKFDVSRERIKQIEAKALRKLRHPSRSKTIKGIYDYMNGTGTDYIYNRDVNKKI